MNIKAKYDRFMLWKRWAFWCNKCEVCSRRTLMQIEIGNCYWICGDEDCIVTASEQSQEDFDRWTYGANNGFTRDTSTVSIVGDSK